MVGSGAPPPTITFLSDYGTADEFVGLVHSVIRQIAPEAAVIDLTHDVPPHDVRAGGLTLARSAHYLAPGVVLAVVDPGVGTDRRGVAIEVGDGESVLVGPDNGLLAPAVSMVGGATAAYELTNPAYRLDAPGATFDGRDVFGPAVAHLCAGVPASELGAPVDPALLQPGMVPLTHTEDGAVTGEVLWVDRFGNAELNVDPAEIDAMGDSIAVEVTTPAGTVTRAATRARSFAELGTGAIGLVVDSYGMVAVVMDRRSASAELGLDAGTSVRLTPAGSANPAGATSPVNLRPRPGADDLGSPSTPSPGESR